MVKNDEKTGENKVAAMQAFINSCYDTRQDNLAYKNVIPATRYQRCYYRSIFDMCDTSKFFSHVDHIHV